MAAPDVTRDALPITVTVNGQRLSGWSRAEVSRDLESLASTASLYVDKMPGQTVPIKRRDTAQIHIGSTLVLTGTVLLADPAYSKSDTGYQVQVRAKTGLLVKCSAIHKGGQWRGATLERIARDIITPFGLELVVATSLGAPIPLFQLGEGETALSALSRAAQLRGVLVTCDELGRVVLGTAGATQFAGAIVRGLNVLEASPAGSDEDRHSEYIVHGKGGGAPLITSLEQFDRARPTATGLMASCKDPDITDYSPLVIQAEGNTSKTELQALVEHTMRVRRGKALGRRYVVDGWTWDGQPWPINQRVRIYDDEVGLSGAEWVIGSSRPHVDLKGGDVTELVVYPPEAFDRTPLKKQPTPKQFKGKGPTDGATGAP